MKISARRMALISSLGLVLGISGFSGASASAQPAQAGRTARTGPAGQLVPFRRGGKVPVTPTWTQVWSDNFTGPAGTAGLAGTWKFDTGQGIFGTGEIEDNTDLPQNVELDGNGNLAITAIDGASGWTSARIQTSRLFGAPAGGEMEVTASIRQPDPADGSGYWPAFWLLGPGQWPENGEIDVLEDVNGTSQHSGTLHCGNLTQVNPNGTYGPCHEYGGIGSGLQPCPGCQAGYNTYSVIVNRTDPADENITWYLNGQQFFAVSESQVPAAVWQQAVDHGFSIIFDLAIGGSYPNYQCHCTAPASGASPQGSMSVASVAVYDLP